jgi:DNA invertase Pin-like site-specific DNA recombinase
MTMSDSQSHHKIKPQHLARRAAVYLRQSSDKQVRENLESQRLQYGLRHRARELGWSEVEILDHDLGSSASMGAPPRADFDRLVGTVALGEVGIIMSREVSRLSRTDKDWCHLMEVCRVFDTLIGDADHVYDLSQMDDQLVLGIKGTMSVVELSVLRQRLLQGTVEKARRGELVRLLPPGYVRDLSAKVVLDPDLRVQQAIAMVFDKFRETWSIRQTFLWFDDEGVELPVNKSVDGRMRIVWQRPTHAFIGALLHNPFYAGAYFYGRRPVETVLKDGRLVKRQGPSRRPEDCRVFIHDHHVGYISWETYEENLQRMRGNAQHGADDSVASVRSGQGLLAGMLRCGRCGRRLHVRYWGKSGTSARYLCKGEYDCGGRYCLGFGGRTVDRRFGNELLRVLSPLGMRASLEALERRSSADDERRQALGLQLQQIEYEAQRAFEQYDAVDARNRLVASELERRWNEKLEEARRLESAIVALDGDAQALTDEERETILTLGERFEQVWWSERCPMELKKKILRTVIEEAVVDLDEETNTLRFVIHWKGGTHTQLEMEKPKSGVGQKTAEEDLDIIRRMAERGYGDDEIAYVLTKHGRRTGKGKRWSQTRVATARRNHSIAGQRRSKLDPNTLSMGAAARHCGISTGTIRRLVSSGLLPKDQVVPWSPWEIHRRDLDSEPVRGIIDHLCKTGKLVLEGVGSDEQIGLFP